MDVLVEKVKDSEVKVEMESKSSDLAEVVNSIRYQYDKLAKKNLKDTEEWYQRQVRLPSASSQSHIGFSFPLFSPISLILFPLSKFENIKVAEAQNNEHLQSGKSELKELLTQKRSLEIKLQAFLSKVNRTRVFSEVLEMPFSMFLNNHSAAFWTANIPPDQSHKHTWLPCHYINMLL